VAVKRGRQKKEARRWLGGLCKSFKKDVVGTVIGRPLTRACLTGRMVRSIAASGHP